MKKKEIKDKETAQVEMNEATVENTETTEVSDVSEIEALQAQIEELQADIEERKDKYLRLYAEFENYRKRVTREKIEVRKLAAEDTIQKLLPVLDDFSRAKSVSENKESGEVFSEGVNLVYEKFKKAMQDCGVVAMESTGEEFDAELHEAFAELPVDDKKKKGIVIDTIETGYYLNDIIIRHAKVVVGK